MKFIVTLEEGMNGYIVAECPQIPGCMSQGKTKEDALANIQDAIGACLEVMVEDMLAERQATVRRRVPKSLLGECQLELRSLELVPA